MKKSISFRIICMILATSMLFANINFVFATGEKVWSSSADDGKIIDKVLEKAIYTSVSKTDRSLYGSDSGKELDFPVIIITDEMIEQVKAETGYKGNIYVRNGKFYLTEETSGYKVRDDGVTGDGVRAYNVQLGSSSENYLDADSTDSETGEEYANKVFANSALEITQDDYKEAYSDMTGEQYNGESDIQAITFAGATLRDGMIYNDDDETKTSWNYTVSFSQKGKGGTVSVKSADGTQVSTQNVVVKDNGKTAFGDYSSSLEKRIPKLSPRMTTDFAIASSENAEKRMIPFSCSNGGTYVIKLFNSSGMVVSDFKIYDEDGNVISLDTKVDGAYASGLLPGKQYYIEVPDGAEYKMEIECVTANDPPYTYYTTYDEQRVKDDIETIYNSNNEDDPEFYEILFTTFVLVMGNMLKNLISIIIGNDLSIDALIFDKYPKTALTFFNQDNGYYEQVNPLFEKGAGGAVGLNKVFGIFQEIAACIYVVILVYMGIRVLLISTADKRAKFKALLLDWVKGIAILFLFPYAIRYAILLNHAIVTYIDASKTSALIGTSPTITAHSNMSITDAEEFEDTTGDNYMQTMYDDAKETLRLSRAICWFIMLVQMIQFWVVYIKRLIKVTFLIAIFPLVTISYAIDKIGDGKSQAFDHWWKEFLLEVFIQSFHAINYVIVMGLVVQFAKSNWFLAIVGITYVVKGGDIIRSLFAQMRGGGAGGPMDLAKSLVKTRVIASGVRKLGGVAGAMTKPVSKGIGKIELGRDKMLDSAYVRTEKRLDEEKRSRGEIFTTQELIQKSSHVTVKRSQEENVTLLKAFEDGNLSDEDMKKFILELGRMSEEELNLALNAMGGTDAFRRKVENLANLGSAATILTSHRRQASGVEIYQSVDICMKNLTNPNATKLLSDLGLDDSRKLRNIAAQHSINLDEDRRQARLQREASMPQTNTTADKINKSIRAFKNAGLGEYNLEEISENVDYLENIRANGTDEEKRLVNEGLQDANFSFEKFKANLNVQIINHSDTIDEDRRQNYVDSAIDNLKNIKDDKRFSSITSNLKTTVGIDDLEKGYIPIIDHSKEIEYLKDQETKLSKEFKKLLSDGKVDLGENYDVYRENYANETRNEGKIAIASGAIETGVGVAAVPVRGAAATTAAVVSMGTAGGDSPLSTAATVMPYAADLTDKTVQLGARLLTGGARKIGQTLEQQQENLDIQRAAYKEGKKRIAEQKEQEFINGVLSQRLKEYGDAATRLRNTYQK